jgi:FMN phosphatase YigB (HAD superfamily)
VQADCSMMFRLEVDNTLLDNDRFRSDLGGRSEQLFGAAGRERSWEIYAELRDALGYADYLATLQRFRVEPEDDLDVLQMSEFVLEYPFAERLYPHALEVIAHLRTLSALAVLSDGHVVFQPRKIQRSGICAAVDRARSTP